MKFGWNSYFLKLIDGVLRFFEINFVFIVGNKGDYVDDFVVKFSYLYMGFFLV